MAGLQGWAPMRRILNAASAPSNSTNSPAASIWWTVLGLGFCLGAGRAVRLGANAKPLVRAAGPVKDRRPRQRRAIGRTVTDFFG